MAVLIVDDNASNIALLKELIREEGLTKIHTETDSRKVRDRLRECRPDLVLLDLHMPHVDGLQVLAQIKAYAAGDYLPVLVLTADTTTGARDHALSHGAHDFLTKPFDAVETTLRIANLLETRELHANLRRAGVVPTPRSSEDRPTRTTSAGASRTCSTATGSLPCTSRSLTSDRERPLATRDFRASTTPVTVAPIGGSTTPSPSASGSTSNGRPHRPCCPSWTRIPPGTFLAINMSPATVLDVVEKELCPPERCGDLVIELTERVPIQDYQAVLGALEEMRSLGTRLAADDRGSGFAGFRHLVSLAPDIIKLDIGLLREFHFKSGQLAITNALVTFADDVGAQVIAEGVEDEAELELLQGLGVTWAQGYHLGKPAPATQWIAG